MKRIPLARPSLGKEELTAIQKVFESGILVEGEVTREFEKEFARYLGIRYAVATSSCTTALDLALLALNIKRGDEVIVPDFTFPATGNVVFHVGAKPVLVDIDIRTYNIDTEKIEGAINSKTRAIIAVHLFGQSANMKRITEIAKDHDLYVIEDAACGIGATHFGRKAGTLGDVACFSFHPRKIVATGEGGMLVTADENLAERVRILKNHGIKKNINNTTRFVEPGYNFRLNDIASALGLVQLRKITSFLRERIGLAKRYNSLFEKVETIKTPFVEFGNNHTYQTYCVIIKKARARDSLIGKLALKGIETQIGTYALHLEPLYRQVHTQGEAKKKVPTLSSSETAYRNTLALPMYNGMRQEIQRYVYESLVDLL